MDIRAPAKINLALAVRSRNAQGYHVLDSLVGFVDLVDYLHFTLAKTSGLEVIGAPPTENPEDNLVLKAMRGLEACGVAPHHILLRKNIPSGAGLGGGSADAAAVLRALGQVVPRAVLYDLALELGADVPVCLFGKPARMQGIGEKITAIADFPFRHLVLIMPQETLSTARVFDQKAHIVFSQKIPDPMQPESWFNDLEAAACVLCPAVRVILTRLRASSHVIAAGMSGTGSCCFAAVPSVQSQQEIMAMVQQEFPDARIFATTIQTGQDV